MVMLERAILTILNKTEQAFTRGGIRTGDWILSEGEPNGFSPAFVSAGDRVAGSGISHGEQPPALLGCKPLPVADGRWDAPRVRVLDGPREKHEFFP